MMTPARFTMPGSLAAMLMAGLLLATSGAALARNSPRDHREGKRPGGRAEGGVTVNGQSTGATAAPTLSVGKGGYDGLHPGAGKGPGSGTTVRDHR
ncbi:MAG: hypothetical protein JWQ17_1176 [Tardiphaga sp.]|jgi:hypothetical protein|nr:hypothetical protein [Tardiphaga sp.]